jgi:hypothetical protein
MKQRNGFVSNSSSSSFLIFGIRLTETDLTPEFKSRFIQTFGSKYTLDRWATWNIHHSDRDEHDDDDEETDELDEFFEEAGDDHGTMHSDHTESEYIVGKLISSSDTADLGPELGTMRVAGMAICEQAGLDASRAHWYLGYDDDH